MPNKRTMYRDNWVGSVIHKRQCKVQIIDQLNLTMQCYQHLYWGSIGTSEVYYRIAKLYNYILNMLWK